MPNPTDQELGRARFRIVLIRVLLVQVVALLALGWLQRHYTR